MKEMIDVKADKLTDLINELQKMEKLYGDVPLKVIVETRKTGFVMHVGGKIKWENNNK